MTAWFNNDRAGLGTATYFHIVFTSKNITHSSKIYLDFTESTTFLNFA